MASKKLMSLIPWWGWVVFIDLFLVLVTLNRDLDYSQAWRLFPAFDLAREMNLAVWWSGILLLVISFVCYEFYQDNRKGFTRPWLSLSVVFFILFVDEISSVHERIDEFILLFGAFILLVFILAAYPLLVFLRDLKNQKTGLFLFFGFGLYASVYAQEFIEHIVQIPSWFLGIRIAIEEGSELLGTLIILFGVLALRKPVIENSIQRMIPEIKLGDSFHTLLWFGLFVQILICFFIFPVLPELDGQKLRGNPGIFYPTIINFALFCYLFWRSKLLQGANRKMVFALSCVFLVSSMGCMYNLSPLVPKVGSYLSEGALFDEFRFLYLAQIVSVIIAIKILDKPLSIKDLLFFIAFISIFALSFFYESLAQTTLLLGLFSFFIGIFFRRLEYEAGDLS